jgi:TPR repeat protein
MSFLIFSVTLFFLLPAQGGVSGIEQSYEKAFNYFSKAAKTEDPSALYHLGFMHENGYGTPVDLTQAATFYQKASRHGNLPATTRLGMMYLTGTGMHQDVSRAKEYVLNFSTSLRNIFFFMRNLRATTRLGMMYLTGAGVHQELSWAKEYV